MEPERDGHTKSKPNLRNVVSVITSVVWKGVYIEERCVASVEVLHVICHITEDFDEEDGALFVNIWQEAQSMFEILEPRWSIVPRPLIHRVHQTKGDYKENLAVDQT